jgi:hypothetical protein
MKASTAMPNPSTRDTATGVIIMYCGSEGDEEGTKAVGRTILTDMEYRGGCGCKQKVNLVSLMSLC